MLRINLSKLIVLSGASVMLVTSSAIAQDTNNWNNQYGSRSALLGGAVVAGVRDTSAGYYNPGALGYINNNSLSVSANAYSYSKATMEDAVGTGEDIDSSNFQAIPTLLSGIYKSEENSPHTFGYSLLARTDASQKFTGRTDTFQDVISEIPGDEESTGQVNFDSSVKEYWAGGTYAYKLNENFSIGSTLFSGIKTQKATRSYTARAIYGEDDLTTVSSTNTFDYYNLRGFGKIGIAADFSPLKAGITFTTPSFNMTGSGEVTSDITVTELLNEGKLNSFTGNDRQESLDAEVTSPMSIAAGLEYDVESSGTTIALSAEYFAERDLYSIIDPEERPFIRPSEVDFGVSSNEFLEVYTAGQDVFNIGLGVEQETDDKWTGYASFRIDNSTYDPEAVGSGYEAALISYDLYHIVAGATYSTEESATSVGLQYTFGSNDEAYQFTDFASSDEDNYLAGDTQQTDVDYSAIALLLGYTYYFE